MVQNKSIVFWDVMLCNPLDVNRVLEVRTASIFRVKK
jgi:hypothetical protein